MKIWSNNWRRIFFCVAAVMMTVVLAGCGAGKSAGGGAKDGKTELKLAYHLPVDHHLSKSMEKFAKRVEEKSGGKLTVKTYPAGQLYTDKSMNDAIMSGGLDMGLNSTAMWTTVIPALNVLDVPFLLPNYDSVAKAIDGGLGKTLEAEFEKKGVKNLIWADYGYVQFANNKRPLTKPEDFAGLQLRGYGQIPAETIKALGASPVTMGSAEVYMAIQRGTIDGQTSGTTALAGAAEGAGGGRERDSRRDPQGDEGRGREDHGSAEKGRYGGLHGARGGRGEMAGGDDVRA